MQKRAARLIAEAPPVPCLGFLITSGVGLTGCLLALVGYQSTLAMFGGSAVATLAWIALHCRQGKLGEPELSHPD
jgi:uncharacterized membrane protein YphA (DoxX/SURF4 family)